MKTHPILSSATRHIMAHRNVYAVILMFFILCLAFRAQNETEPVKKSTLELPKASATPHEASSASFFSSLAMAKTLRYSGAPNIVFKSDDGGQTWQDIGEGLPEKLDHVEFFTSKGDVFLSAGNEVYHRNSNSAIPVWNKEAFPKGHNSIAQINGGIVAYNYDGQFSQRINTSNTWAPMYTNFQGKEVRTVFESDRGTIFIGNDKGLFKSTNNGNTWRQVHKQGGVGKLIESNGVLIATSQNGIIRSTDDGEHWDLTIGEGGVGITAELIDGGFAAITFNTTSLTRRVRTSYDGGKSWQPIDESLPEQASIASIVQVGDYFFCGHPAGIFRSSDKGKTWKLLVPSIENKVFNLFVSGKVIYAIPRDGGC